MTRRNSLALTAEDVEKHNAKVRAQRFVFSPSSSALMEELHRYKYSAPAPVEKVIGSGSLADVDAELRSLGVPMHLLPVKNDGVAELVDAPSSSRALRLPCSNVDRARMPEGHVGTIAGSSPAAVTKKPRMNKLEAEWAMILEARKRAGEIIWYQFEGLRLRLANGAYFTPDFPVLTKDGALEFCEVKGFWREAARLRIRVAADLYPFWKFYAVRKIKKKDGGGWDIEGF